LNCWIVLRIFAQIYQKPVKMNVIKKTLGALMAAGVVALCSCGPKLPELPVEEVKPYFSDAAKTKAMDTAYYEVKDAKGNKLGTVLFSSPYSDGIKGFNGPTPLLIALDADGRINNVVLLENQETPNFAKRVVDGGLYQAWNGLTVDEALDKQVDAVSGATFTSNGVKKSLIARLKAYQKQLK
jgi:Na+-translocating ferredoxin:NAD+ oxidoreductase RnfG subunit